MNAPQQSFGPVIEPIVPYRAGSSPGWRRHDGSQPEPDDDFLTVVEPSIGTVLSASTNFAAKGFRVQTSQQRTQRIALVTLGVIFGGLGGVAVGEFVSQLAWELLRVYVVREAAMGWCALFGAVGLSVVFLGLAILLRMPAATWVAQAGLQRYTRRPLLGPKLEFLRFEDAEDLQVSRVRQIVNGVYTGTVFDYRWRRRDGATAFRIHGTYRDTQPIQHFEGVAFAFAAENAWSVHRIAWFRRALQQHGVVRFACGKETIGIGRGFVEIGKGGNFERIEASELLGVSLEQGVLVIKRKGSREGLFSSEGVHRFQIAKIGDFQVLVAMFGEQLGIRFA